MASPVKILRLYPEEAELVLIAVNEARISHFTPTQRKRLPELLHRLNQYSVASPQELSYDIAEEKKDILCAARREQKASPQLLPEDLLQNALLAANRALRGENSSGE